MKTAVISDLHFSRKPDGPGGERIGGYADIFLLRTVHRLKRYIKPDLVFVGGDLLDDPNASDAAELLLELKNILALLDMPVIVIPGNHDPSPDDFYRVMPRPPEYLDVNGIRFIPFPDDPQTAGWNARREPAELARMKSLAASHAGPVISLQHVPLFTAGAYDCPYNYDNSAEVMNAMRSSKIKFAISGHFHRGFQVSDSDGFSSIAAPALCETPFRFMTVDFDKRGKILQNEIHSLALPEELHLIDYHVHTRFAYCNENMDVSKSLELGSLFKLDSIAFSEHSAHLYLNKKDYYATAYYPKGIAVCKLEPRMDEYFAELDKVSGQRFLRGLEIDFDSNGNPVAREADLKKVGLRIGAVHYLESRDDVSAVKNEFMYQVGSILSYGVDILAHPFRAFIRRNMPVPKELYGPVADLLREADTAAEINFHTNTPDPEFVHLCIDKGVKIAFGSDAHNLYEVGELHPHLELMREIGFIGKTADILFRPATLS